MMLVSLGLGAVLAVSLITLLSVLTGGRVTSTTLPTSALVGHRLVPFSGPGLHGGTVHAPWASGHPTVVVFYASFCDPCRRELPKVAHYVATHSLGAVRVVGVDATDTLGAGRAFTATSGVTFPVVFDASGSITSGLFHFVGLPETAYVAGNGVVRSVTVGPTTVAGLRDGLATLR
jgi:cytochrome c biogenesis protein CcmG/thiol:disulfide interchange protein DsbE